MILIEWRTADRNNLNNNEKNGKYEKNTSIYVELEGVDESSDIRGRESRDLSKIYFRLPPPGGEKTVARYRSIISWIHSAANFH